MSRIQRVRLAIARVLLTSTEHIAVPVKEIKRVEELCDELSTYVPISGGLNDPRRIKARHRVGNLADALTTYVSRLKEGVNA